MLFIVDNPLVDFFLFSKYFWLTLLLHLFVFCAVNKCTLYFTLFAVFLTPSPTTCVSPGRHHPVVEVSRKAHLSLVLFNGCLMLLYGQFAKMAGCRFLHTLHKSIGPVQTFFACLHIPQQNGNFV